MAGPELSSGRDKVFSGLAPEERAGHEKGADISSTVRVTVSMLHCQLYCALDYI